MSNPSDHSTGDHQPTWQVDKNLKFQRDRLAKSLFDKDLRIVFAESCTAGLCSATLAQVPGISSHLCGSSVTYRARTKVDWLNVSKDTIEELTCESLGVADEMARGVMVFTPEADVSAAVVGHIADGQDCVVYIAIIVRGDMKGPAALNSTKLIQRKLTAGGNRIDRQKVAVQEVFEAVFEAIKPFST